jgi:hypothetical protein
LKQAHPSKGAQMRPGKTLARIEVYKVPACKQKNGEGWLKLNRVMRGQVNRGFVVK